ncbi:MAG: hypothetical protein ABI234_12980 [Ktedonobacteraceae bacterium]
MCSELVRSHLACYEGVPLCGTSQLLADYAPPTWVDALRVLLGWAVVADLLAVCSSGSSTGSQECGRKVSYLRVLIGSRQCETSNYKTCND